MSALTPGTPKYRRLIGAARLRKLIDFAQRGGGVSRVELVRAGTFAPMGDPQRLTSDANSVLREASLPWTAVTADGHVWIERDADHAGR